MESDENEKTRSDQILTRCQNKYETNSRIRFEFQARNTASRIQGILESNRASSIN